MRKSLLFLAIAIPAFATSWIHAAASATRSDLRPVFRGGDRFDNVFSRAMAIRAKGFDDVVWRISGSGSYRVTAAGGLGMQGSFRYDGRPESDGVVEFRNGGAISCFNGKCTANTDASGLVYNPLQWGTPPAELHVGQSWTVDIAAPWELGTPGRQTVTVMAVDPMAHSVTLRREGQGDGAYADDVLQTRIQHGGKTYDVALQPGHSHWYGYTTFRRGIVTSDELMVSKGLGRIVGDERQYILLNAMPVVAGHGDASS
jgi:hypothetical protein